MTFEEFIEAKKLPRYVIAGDIRKLTARGVELDPMDPDVHLMGTKLPEGWNVEAYPPDGDNYAVLKDENDLPVAQIFYRPLATGKVNTHVRVL